MRLHLEQLTERVGAEAGLDQGHRNRAGLKPSGTSTPLGVHVTIRNRGSGRLRRWEALR